MAAGALFLGVLVDLAARRGVAASLVVLKTLFQFSDWIVTRYLDVFQPKETEFGVKNIKKFWDRAPPRP